MAAKEVLGASVLLAILVVAAISLRLYAAGPQWGLQLGQAADGSVIALAVRGHGVAWEQHIRAGDRILVVDSLDAHNFVGGEVGGVGGLMHKVAAAARAGRKHLVIPAANADVVDGLPTALRTAIEIHPVAMAREALTLALGESERW